MATLIVKIPEQETPLLCVCGCGFVFGWWDTLVETASRRAEHRKECSEHRMLWVCPKQGED